MAEITLTRRERFSVGNRWMEFGRTASTSSGHVATTMSKVSYGVHWVMNLENISDGVVFKNAQSAVTTRANNGDLYIEEDGTGAAIRDYYAVGVG